MHTVKTADLKPGMVTAERVKSRLGQLIVEKNKLLSRQMIAHIEYYNIPSVKILDGLLPDETIDTMAAERQAAESYFQKVRESKEYREFKESYAKKVDFLEHSLNDAVVKNMPLDKDALLEQVMELFTRNATTISMFDMLHNMRSINDSTYAHSLNVALIGRMIGMWMNFDSRDLDILVLGGLLHDIGKSKVPEAILNKPARLTLAEFEEIKKHPVYGYEMLRDMPIDSAVKQIALNHHERCDGSGYPIGLCNDEIDDFSIIIAIADVYDAMTADRIYRSGMCPFDVIATFEHEGLNKYKPQYIMTFLERIANTYVNNNVLLSNGVTGKIVLINRQHLTRPVIQTADETFINLEKHPEIYVQAII